MGPISEASKKLLRRPGANQDFEDPLPKRVLPRGPFPPLLLEALAALSLSDGEAR